MVAGDLVNTASRVQSVAEPGHGVRRRVDAPRDRADDRLRGRGLVRAQGQGGADAALEGAARRLRPARLAQVRRDSRRRSSAATASCGRSRISSTRSADETQGTPRLGDGHRRHRQVAARVGVLQVLRRHRGRPSTGTAGAASPTARASRTGRSRTWCACAAASPRRRSRRLRCPSCTPTLEEHFLDAEERSFLEPRLAHLLGLAEHQARDQQDLFAAWRLFFERLVGELSDGARLRGHAVGGREPARLRRVPARLVAEPPDLRGHARAARAARAPADLGRRAAELHVALPGAALAAGDGGAAGRARARAARGGSRPHPRPRRGHPAVRGRDRADAARPRPARAGRPGVPAHGRGRSARGARRRCTR